MYRLNPAVSGVVLLIGGLVLFMAGAFFSDSNIAMAIFLSATLTCLLGFSFVIGAEREE